MSSFQSCRVGNVPRRMAGSPGNGQRFPGRMAGSLREWPGHSRREPVHSPGEPLTIPLSSNIVKHRVSWLSQTIALVPITDRTTRRMDKTIMTSAPCNHESCNNAAVCDWRQWPIIDFIILLERNSIMIICSTNYHEISGLRMLTTGTKSWVWVVV